MGFVVYWFRFLSPYVLFVAILYFMHRIFSNSNKKDEVLLAAGYVMGFEVFSRMTGGAFSYEFAKYAVIGFLLIGMFFIGFKKSSWPYIFYILLLVPGVLFSAINLNYDSSVANAIGFNLSGPVCLGISALYCYNRKMPRERLQDILLAVLLPIVATTTYLFLYTPSIRDVLSGTESNFEASGGYGPNQVATVLGLGMFILFTRLFVIKNRWINLIDLALLALMSYRAIITFSRGGVLTAVACAVIFLGIFLLRSNARQKAILLPKIVIIATVIFCTWFISSIATMGLIENRYANEDAAGREKGDVGTGRVALFSEELNAFRESPITGLGIGKAKEYRMEETGNLAATHNEVSRLLSEHGVLGLLALLILLLTPLFFRMQHKANVYLFSFLVFWFLTINHSSMRIAAPAFIYGLSLITIINATKKPAVHRK